MSSIDRRRLVGRSRLSRRQMLGLGAGAGAAFLVACGGSGDQSGGAVAEATREAGVVSGGQDTGEAPRPGGSLSVAWPLTPPLDPVANSTYTAQRLASFVYPRLLKFKTDADPRTAQAYEIIPDMAAAMPRSSTMAGATSSPCGQTSSVTPNHRLTAARMTPKTSRHPLSGSSPSHATRIAVPSPAPASKASRHRIKTPSSSGWPVHSRRF